MSQPIQMHNGCTVYQACGDVIVVEQNNKVTTAHYGELGIRVDDAARRSLSEVERKADALRRGN